MIPVPASFADLYTDKELRDFCGDVWYETSFFVPGELQGSIVELRFGAVAHRAEVYVNGEKRGFHEGGFVPFCVDVTDCVRYQEENRLVVLVNNELSDTSLPAGETEILKSGRKKAVPYFDFFNYSGIIRPVWLMSTPRHRICDYSVRHEISGKDACTWYQVEIENPEPDIRMEVRLWDEEGKLAAYSEGMEGKLVIADVHLWEVRNAYLYRLELRLFQKDQLLDEYSEEIGIRTVRIQGTEILLNEKPIYLKGFGRHEDSPVLGRGFSLGFLKRDFELMKWIGANSFRTSHYPYAEEAYQMADREIFQAAKAWDVQKRPCSFAMALSSQPEDVVCHQYCDFLCMNRYYGWYVKGGSEISDAKEAFLEEMERWAALDPQRPMIFTEYGADTLSYEHKLPSVMWSQEYQIEYLKMYHEIFDRYDFVRGEQVWNFADFQTVETTGRANGNRKGIFTRDRQPKDGAFLMRRRWLEEKSK